MCYPETSIPRAAVIWKRDGVRCLFRIDRSPSPGNSGSHPPISHFLATLPVSGPGVVLRLSEPYVQNARGHYRAAGAKTQGKRPYLVARTSYLVSRCSKGFGPEIRGWLVRGWCSRRASGCIHDDRLQMGGRGRVARRSYLVARWVPAGPRISSLGGLCAGGRGGAGPLTTRGLRTHPTH